MAFVFGSLVVVLMFPTAWESHNMNRCVSDKFERLKKTRPGWQSHFDTAVERCNGK